MFVSSYGLHSDPVALSNANITLALTGAQHAPRSGNLLPRVRAEQLVNPHSTPLLDFSVNDRHLIGQIGLDECCTRPRRIAFNTNFIALN